MDFLGSSPDLGLSERTPINVSKLPKPSDCPPSSLGTRLEITLRLFREPLQKATPCSFSAFPVRSGIALLAFFFEPSPAWGSLAF